MPPRFQRSSSEAGVVDEDSTGKGNSLLRATKPVVCDETLADGESGGVAPNKPRTEELGPVQAAAEAELLPSEPTEEEPEEGFSPAYWAQRYQQVKPSTQCELCDAASRRARKAQEEREWIACDATAQLTTLTQRNQDRVTKLHADYANQTAELRALYDQQAEELRMAQADLQAAELMATSVGALKMAAKETVCRARQLQEE